MATRSRLSASGRFALISALALATAVLAATAPSRARESTTTIPRYPPTSAAALSNRSPLPQRSPPVTLTIPAIHVSTKVGSLGLTSTGEVQVPLTAATVGWYRLGPTPGQQGAAVILGHVDSYVGPGVFFHLDHLMPGDKITVVLANGESVVFRVIRIREYLKTAFPNRLVYLASSGRWLNLVTCGGQFDRATGHYLSDIVVFASYISMHR